MSGQKKPSAWGPREIIVLAFLFFVFGVFAILERPKFVTGSPPSQASICVNRLRQIDAAANQFALENRLTNGEAINFPGDLTPYIKLDRAGKIPECPAGGVYHLGKVGETPACSLSATITPAHVLP